MHTSYILANKSKRRTIEMRISIIKIINMGSHLDVPMVISALRHVRQQDEMKQPLQRLFLLACSAVPFDVAIDSVVQASMDCCQYICIHRICIRMST